MYAALYSIAAPFLFLLVPQGSFVAAGDRTVLSDSLCRGTTAAEIDDGRCDRRRSAATGRMQAGIFFSWLLIRKNSGVAMALLSYVILEAIGFSAGSATNSSTGYGLLLLFAAAPALFPRRGSFIGVAAIRWVGNGRRKCERRIAIRLASRPSPSAGGAAVNSQQVIEEHPYLGGTSGLRPRRVQRHRIARVVRCSRRTSPASVARFRHQIARRISPTPPSHLEQHSPLLPKVAVTADLAAAVVLVADSHG